jgi:RNA polymerase sigma-70 factor (ECF subfamily)
MPKVISDDQVAALLKVCEGLPAGVNRASRVMVDIVPPRRGDVAELRRSTLAIALRRRGGRLGIEDARRSEQPSETSKAVATSSSSIRPIRSRSCGGSDRVQVVFGIAPRTAARVNDARPGQDKAVDIESDAAVIAASRDEPPMFAAVFDRHYAAVYRYLARRVGAILAEDFASQTFTVAFDARHRYDLSRPDARPWLFGIATNLVRHHRRAELRRIRAYARLDRTPETSRPDMIADQRRGTIYGAADALGESARDRDALLLFAWADLRYEEIAVALQIPVGTVRSRLHRARRRLRELLGADGQSMVDETRTEVLPADG